MGLDILISLAHIIHKAVCNTPFLATEPGCKDFAENLKLKNTSLLVSVPSKLEPYPGRNSSHSWMGKSAVRFWEAQRGHRLGCGPRRLGALRLLCTSPGCGPGGDGLPHRRE